MCRAMCRKYKVRGENLTLNQVLDRLNNKPTMVDFVYSKQEINSAARILDKLSSRVTNRKNSSHYKKLPCLKHS